MIIHFPFPPRTRLKVFSIALWGSDLVHFDRLHLECEDVQERCWQSARITRLLAIVRAHGPIMKVQKTHRYSLTAQGRRIVSALVTAHAANAEKLASAA